MPYPWPGSVPEEHSERKGLVLAARGLCFALSHSVKLAGVQAPCPGSTHTHLLRPQAHPKGLGLSSPLCCSVLSQTVQAFIIFEQGPSAPVASLVQTPGPSCLPDEDE